MITFPLMLLSFQVPIAPTPPMGWNSYDCYSYAVNETETMANAEYMAKNLRKLGWQYVVVDYVWSAPRGKPNFAPDQNSNFEPRLNMDQFGRLLPDVARFPSSANGAGFRVLSDKIHRLGLKFGIHLMRGIPRQAVAANTPIDGSSSSARDAANPKSTCPWLNHMYGLNMSKSGQAYLDSIFRLYAKWGVDFVKVDDLSRPYSESEVAGYRAAIDRCGRSMVLSLSPGATPLSAANHVTKNANMWRLLDDLWDDWTLLNPAFETAASWLPHQSQNHWPDLDMLPFGRLRKFGPNTGPVDSNSRLSHDEARSIMSLWCMTRGPLMFGGNLPETDPDTLSLITNRELIDVDQHSFDNRAIRLGPSPVFAATLGNDRLIALFNRRSESPIPVSVRLSDLGIARCGVTDVWNGKSLGERSGEVTATLSLHGCAVYRLKVLKSCPITRPEPYVFTLEGTSYEAESPKNFFGGSTVAGDDPSGKCSGGKLVRYIGRGAGNVLRFAEVQAESKGKFTLAVAYVCGEDRRGFVSINGGPKIAVKFRRTGGWTGEFLDFVELQVELKAGANTVEISNETNYAADIDRITIRR